MNFVQRAAVGFTAFALVAGVASAPAHDVPLYMGLLVGLTTLAITAAIFGFIEWVVAGREGLSYTISQLWEGVKE